MGTIPDLVIENVMVYDGTGRDPFVASIGIRENRIEVIAPGLMAGARTIDANGLCACPGFVDTHGHSEFTILRAPSCESKILQGVTTEINGNCGLSAAPLLGDASSRREEDLKELGIADRWSSFSEYFSLLGRRKIRLNFASLAGHGNIRASVMGYRTGDAIESEIAAMAGLLRQSLDEGAWGLSTGLIYPPGIFTGADEIAHVLTGARTGGQIVYSTHMRSEGDELIESVEEALEIGAKGGARIHLSHLKTAGRENWHKIDHVLTLLDQAASSGVAVTFDRYPYTAASTDLDSILPAWVYEGGAHAEVSRLTDRETRARVREHLRLRYADRAHYASVVVSTVATERNRWAEGKSILEIAEAKGVCPEDAVLDLIVQEGTRVGAIFHSMSEDNLRRFLTHPLCMVGSDSAVRGFSGVTAQGRPHPRAFGTFPRYLGKYVIGEGLMPLQEGIRRITSLPARTFGLSGRGLVREGFFADVVVFDPSAIRDRATFGDPFRPPDGIRYVLVNGAVAVSDGELSGEEPAGMILRRTVPAHAG